MKNYYCKEKKMEKYKESVLNKELSNKKKLWYSNNYVIENLLNSLKFKEVTLKSHLFDEYCIRGLNIRNFDFLNYVFKFYNFFERDYNIYISNADFNFIPFFNMNLKKRSFYTSQWFQFQAETHIISYDILLDFDSKGNHIEMKSEVYKTLKLLNKFKIVYYIIPSGNNFQIVIKNYFLTFDDVKTITQLIKDILKLKYLDLSGCGNPFKIMKCPFSWVDEIVCIPLRKKEIDSFMNWNYRKLFDSNNVLKTFDLKNSKYYFQNSCSETLTDIRLKEFLKKIEVW